MTMPRTKRQQPGQDEGNATPPKRSKSQPDTNEPIRYLACQFYVRSPLEFPHCHPWLGDRNKPHNMFDPERPSDLDQHHRRRHKLPLHCQRCWKVFERADQQVSHAREAVSCVVVSSAPFVGVTLQKLNEMAKASRGMLAKDRWHHYYTAMFPGEPSGIPSPYATPEYHFIDMVTQYIESISNVPQSSVKAICQYIQSQRLLPRTVPPSDSAPGSAAPEAAADVEFPTQVVGGLPGEREISGPASSEAEESMLMYIDYPDEAGLGLNNAGQDMLIPTRTANPTRTVNPADLHLRRGTLRQEAPTESPSLSGAFGPRADDADHSE